MVPSTNLVSTELTAHVLLVFGLVALYAAQAQQNGLPGAPGMILGVVGTTVVFQGALRRLDSVLRG